MSSAGLVRRLSGALEGKLSRRGFFTRTAMAGTAMAVAPTDFVLRPTTAYAAICTCQGQSCDCGSLCCDGYTEFCCTLTGRNTCPPGSTLGGWWKVDGSSFCGGPRYYMDCNAPCNGCGCGGGGICSGSCSGTGCGCALGDCNNRKAGCVNFRYGQCNQHVACLGPIVCRLVSCIPPWEIDGSCTTTLRVDEYTRYHDRPCLHAVNGALELVTDAPGGARVAGWALDPDTSQSVQVEVLVDGVLTKTVTANLSRADIAAAFPGMGPLHGFDTTVPISGGGSHEVCVRVVNRGPDTGTRTQLGCGTVTRPSPVGSLDIVAPVEPGRIRIAGWALDPDTTAPISVHLYIDGVGQAITADLSRPDVAAAYGKGDRHGFDLTVDVAPGAHEVCAYAINVGPGSNVALGCRSVEVGRPVGNVERLVAQPGGVRITGWALDPDTADPIDLAVSVDGVVVGTITADIPRADVAAIFPDPGGDHGFDDLVPVGPGAHRICVAALDSVGGSRPTTLTCRDVVVGGDPQGVIESVRAAPGGVRIIGWALDPDTAGPVSVHVYVDGVGTAITADRPRSDIAKVFPGWGDAHGFDVTIPVAAGAHTVCAYAINIGPGGARSPLLGCRSVVTGASPVGNLEAVRDAGGALRIIGWALDPDTADPLSVHVYVDGVGQAVVADTTRNDIATAFPGWGADHGFDVTIPASAGTHEVCVYAINRGSGGNVLLACRTGAVA